MLCPTGGFWERLAWNVSAYTSQVLNHNAGVLIRKISHTDWASTVRPCTVQKGRILVCWDHRSTAGVLIRLLAFQYPECSSGFPSLFPCSSSEFPELATKGLMQLLLSKYIIPGGWERQWKISGLTYPNLEVPFSY